MRLFAITIFVLVGALMAKPVTAQDAKPPLDAAAAAKIKSEVSDVVASYLKAFNARDLKGFAEIHAIPSFVVLPSGNIVANLYTEDIAKRFGDAIKQLMAEGWDRTKLDIASVCVLTANTALASGRTTRYRTDGSVMGVLAATLVSVRTDAGWRIAGVMLQQPNKIVTCNE